MKRVKQDFAAVMPTVEQLLTPEQYAEYKSEAPPPPMKLPYRKLALEHYRRMIGGSAVNVCVMCGFGIPSILEVAHLNQDRKDDSIENLAVLCPNCHKMHDIGLIPTDVIRALRDEHRTENWKLRIKDAGAKAAATRRASSQAKKKSAAAKKAWATRSKAA